MHAIDSRNVYAINVSKMEIFELRYFLSVARFESVHQASEHTNVSPAALSKAVTRLEQELSVKLFSREGRNIRLTDHGLALQRRASEIVRLEESTRIEVGGTQGKIHIVIAAPEILLGKFGLTVSLDIKKRLPRASFEYIATTDELSLDFVARGDAQIGITTCDVPPTLGLTTRVLGDATFQTFVGFSHPLYAPGQAKKIVPVEDLLKYPFVSPTHALLGQVGAKQSLDGWRDDRFPRKIDYRTSSLKTLEEFVVSGAAVAYLPDYFCENKALQTLKISGCPYACTQKVRLVAKNPRDVGWLNRLF